MTPTPERRGTGSRAAAAEMERQPAHHPRRSPGTHCSAKKRGNAYPADPEHPDDPAGRAEVAYFASKSPRPVPGDPRSPSRGLGRWITSRAGDGPRPRGTPARSSRAEEPAGRPGLGIHIGDPGRDRPDGLRYDSTGPPRGSGTDWPPSLFPDNEDRAAMGLVSLWTACPYVEGTYSITPGVTALTRAS